MDSEILFLWFSLQRKCNANVCVALLLRQHHFLNHTFVYKFTKRLLTNCRKDVSIKSYSWSYLIRIYYAPQSQQVFSKPLAPQRITTISDLPVGRELLNGNLGARMTNHRIGNLRWNSHCMNACSNKSVDLLRILK